LGGERIPSIVEMSRITEMEREAPEQQITTYKRGNNNQEDTVKNATEKRKVGTLAYNIKRKWKIQAKRVELRLGREQE
jgi:hypothetical protein